ncbi:MAG: hypothetical protein JNL98_39090 [Bryobacterales bacterium]|nr:hypothetical protein [Bryobacterales bacterium]
MPETQNFQNHARLVTGFHKILFPILLLTFIGGCVNLYRSLGDHSRLYNSALILVLVGCSIALFFYCRIFALKAQDRAIKAEESLRHFILTGKPLDARLSVRQIIALRFAPDEEFPALAQRAAHEQLEPTAIKKEIKNWRADYYRV